MVRGRRVCGGRGRRSCGGARRLWFAAAARAGLVDDLDVGQVVDEPARRAGAAAQVGVLEVHKEAFVERPDPRSVSLRMTMQAPETQSTAGWDLSVTAGNWLFTRELLGKRRVRREVRPRKPERALISRRAES